MEQAGLPKLDDLDLLFRVLAPCPNLKKLDLDINRRDCEVSNATPFAFDFMSSLDVRFAPAESSTLGEYRLDERSVLRKVALAMDSTP